MSVIDRIAPGDAIPLHTRTTDDVVMVVSGRGTYRLGNDESPVEAGAIVFIPAGVPHGTRADDRAEEPEGLAINALLPAGTLDITYLERNPAPGTEDDPPQPPLRFDPRVDDI